MWVSKLIFYLNLKNVFVLWPHFGGEEEQGRGGSGLVSRLKNPTLWPQWQATVTGLLNGLDWLFAFYGKQIFRGEWCAQHSDREQPEIRTQHCPSWLTLFRVSNETVTYPADLLPALPGFSQCDRQGQTRFLAACVFVRIIPIGRAGGLKLCFT